LKESRKKGFLPLDDIYIYIMVAKDFTKEEKA